MFSDHPLVLLIQLAMAAAYGAASYGLLRAARSTGDPLLKWVAAGAASSAFARANYALFPSLYTEFIYTGRCASAGLLPVDPGGASQEVRGYWRRLEADIVERNQLVSELERLALDDSLTRLKNRRGLEVAFEDRGAKPIETRTRWHCCSSISTT